MVCDLNLIMEKMPPLFNDTQQLDEYEIVDLLAKKAPRTHKARMISQGLNPKTGDLATFVEHFERDENADNIALSKFPDSDLDINTIKSKKLSKKAKKREDSRKKSHKDSSCKTPHLIVASMEKIQDTPQRVENSSWKRRQKRKSQSMSRNNTRRSLKNSISCKQKLPIINPSMKS